MRASYKAYEDVATNCSGYEKSSGKNSFTDRVSDEDSVSCLTCKHFDEDEHCVLDLYDKVAESRGISPHNTEM
jgi:hypothetical protein